MLRLLGRWLENLHATLFLVRVGTTAGYVVGLGLILAAGLPAVQWGKDRYGAAAYEAGPLMVTAMAVLVAWLAVAFCVQWVWLFTRSVRREVNRIRR